MMKSCQQDKEANLKMLSLAKYLPIWVLNNSSYFNPLNKIKKQSSYKYK